jgi:lambda repressor-like predicted transcriptional regulator
VRVLQTYCNQISQGKRLTVLLDQAQRSHRPVTDHPKAVKKMHVLTDDEVAQLVELYQAGRSVRSLGRQFSLHEQTVQAHLRRCGVTLRPQQALTAEQVPALVARYQSGASLRQLEREFGVADNTVRNYLIKAGVKLRPARRMPAAADR